MTASPPAAPAILLRRLRVLCVLLLSAAPVGLAQTTQPYRPTLLAFGSADRYWLASVESYREVGKVKYKTLVRGQALPAGDWKDLGVIYGHAAALAETQGDLALLLDDGSWKRLGEGGLATGPSDPGTGPVHARGNTGSKINAIRAVE
jgi:hypothetical protein